MNDPSSNSRPKPNKLKSRAAKPKLLNQINSTSNSTVTKLKTNDEHKLQHQQQHQINIDTSTSTSMAQTSKPAPRINKTSDMLEPIPTNVIDNNLDNILDDVRQLDNTCDFSRCRTKTTYIGQDCVLCKQRYCMKHQLPEVHGCGGAIKKVERNEFLKKPNQSLPISAALRRNEQKGAHARLEQKLKEMSLARKKSHK